MAMRRHTPGTDPPQFEEFGPRTRRQAWREHVAWVQQQIAEKPRMRLRLEMMLERQRQYCIDGVFPFSLPFEEPPREDEIELAIAEIIAERGRHIGRDELWRLVQDWFLGCEIPRKKVEELMPKRGRGRPSKGKM